MPKTSFPLKGPKHKTKNQCGPVLATSLYIRSGKREIVEEDPEKPSTLTELFQENPKEKNTPEQKIPLWKKFLNLFRKAKK